MGSTVPPRVRRHLAAAELILSLSPAEDPPRIFHGATDGCDRCKNYISALLHLLTVAYNSRTSDLMELVG